MTPTQEQLTIPAAHLSFAFGLSAAMWCAIIFGGVEIWRLVQ